MGSFVRIRVTRRTGACIVSGFLHHSLAVCRLFPLHDFHYDSILYVFLRFIVSLWVPEGGGTPQEAKEMIF